MGDAESKNDMIYVKKANSLKRSREKTVGEITILEKTLLNLEENKSRL